MCLALNFLPASMLLAGMHGEMRFNMMKAPSKTKLTVIKSYIDMAFANPEDWYGAIQLMHRIETEI
jgi:hypothetical protein